MSRQHDEQVIALAGVFQAANLVSQIARRGMVPQNSFETSIASLFITNPDLTEDIFGGVRDIPFNLSVGLRSLQELCDKQKSEQNADMMRYALSAIHLERKLNDRPDMLQTIGQRLEGLQTKARYFNPDLSEPSENELDQGASFNPSQYTHSNVIAGLASLYQDTLSTFSFRVQVGGDPRHLQNPDNAAKIRALLLASVRAAMLWRQVGGKRWHLFFFKSRVRPSLKRIMAKH